MMRLVMAGRAWYRRILAALWLLWAVMLLMVYYKQLWNLFIVRPSAWLADNYSLALVRALWHLPAAGPLAWGLPAFSEALTRALTAIFGSGLVLIAAQVLGVSICRLLRWYPEDWREGLLYHTAVGLGAVSYLSLGLAALGLYYSVNIQILIAVVLLGGSLWFFSWVRSNSAGQQVKALTKLVSSGHYRAGDRVWQAIALVGVLIALVGALAPEIEYDALWYHLWLPKLWLEEGHLVDKVAEYTSLYPLTWELLFGAGMVCGGPIAAKLLHFACLPLAGLLTYQLTHRFIPLASPWLAVALFVTVPTVLWEATTTYIDLALTFHTGLVIYALLRYVEERRWQWLALATLNLGLALATKHLALFVLVLSTSGLALRLWLKERDLRQALVPAMLFGGLSLLLPLPWYLRSWLASGNPFFPDLFGVFGALPPERWNVITERGLAHFKAHFGRPRTALNLLTLPWDMTIHAARYGGTLGPMFMLLLPGLATRHRRAQATPWLLAFVLVYVALWASPVSSFQMRFLIPLTPLLAVLAAESCSRLRELLKGLNWVKVIAYGGIAGLLLLNLPPFTSLHERDRVMWNGWLTHIVHEVPLGVVVGRESREDYLARKVPSYTAWRYINTYLSHDARVLAFSGGDHFYSQRDRIASDATIAYPVVWGAAQSQERQAIQAMSQLGISHVLFDKHQLESGDLDDLAIAQPAMMTGWYDLEYEDSRFILYRLNWDADGDQDYHTIATQGGVIEVQPALKLAQDQTPASIADIRVSLLIGLSIVLVAGTMLIILQRNSVMLNSRIRTSLCARRLAYLRDLLREMVVRDMKLRYKRSILGVAWSLLNPLVQMLVFIFLFRRVMALDIPNYPSFVFTGVLAWNWFQSAVLLATGAITGNRELIRRPGFPMAILPVVTVTTNMIHFLLALPVPLFFLALGGGRLTSAILALPLVIALQFLLILGLGYLVATFQVTFRDTQHLLGVLLMLLFYLTPVFYDASIIPARFHTFYQLNPMVHLITAYRAILIQGDLPDLRALLVLGVLGGVLLWLGHAVFTRASTRFVEEL